jgi:hypothetical protein
MKLAGCFPVLKRWVQKNPTGIVTMSLVGCFPVLKRQVQKNPTGIATMSLVGCFPALKRWVQKIPTGIAAMSLVGCFPVLKRWAQSPFFHITIHLANLLRSKSVFTIANSCTSQACEKEEMQRVV